MEVTDTAKTAASRKRKPPAERTAKQQAKVGEANGALTPMLSSAHQSGLAVGQNLSEAFAAGVRDGFAANLPAAMQACIQEIGGALRTLEAATDLQPLYALPFATEEGEILDTGDHNLPC